MAMKILLIVMLVMALEHGEAERCIKRIDVLQMPPRDSIPRCRKPQFAAVQLPVPKGFDYVRPSVVNLTQCTGLACEKFPEKCLPAHGNITTRTFKVNAFNAKNKENGHCVEVEVEEHHECECECENKCQHNTIFNKNTCACDCNSEDKAECDHRRYNEKIPVMWSTNTCSCKCDTIGTCGSGMVWAEKECRCKNKVY